MTDDIADFDHLLDDGEHILWSGKPSPSGIPNSYDKIIRQVGAGLLVLLSALYLFTWQKYAGAGLFQVTPLLIIVAISVPLALLSSGMLILPKNIKFIFELRHLDYLITNYRALVYNRKNGRLQYQCELDGARPLETDGGSIIFRTAHDYRVDNRGIQQEFKRLYGFHLLKNPQEVERIAQKQIEINQRPF